MTPLRAYRKANGKTLSEIAEGLGLSEGQLSRIERFGTTQLDVALKLAALTKSPAASFQKEESA